MVSLDHVSPLQSQMGMTTVPDWRGHGQPLEPIPRPDSVPGTVPGGVAAQQAFTTGAQMYSPRNWKDRAIGPTLLEGGRSLELIVGISYRDDLEQVLETLRTIVAAEGAVASRPGPEVTLHQLIKNQVELLLHLTVRPEEYWEVVNRLTRSIKLRFFEEGIAFATQGRTTIRLRTAPDTPH